jgi:hypothetical protein
MPDYSRHGVLQLRVTRFATDGSAQDDNSAVRGPLYFEIINNHMLIQPIVIALHPLNTPDGVLRDDLQI